MGSATTRRDCRACGKNYAPFDRGADARHCSTKCRTAERECVACSEPFKPFKGTEVFCSASCFSEYGSSVEVTVDPAAARDEPAWMVWVQGNPCSPRWNSKGAAEAYAVAVRRGDRKPELEDPTNDPIKGGGP